MPSTKHRPLDATVKCVVAVDCDEIIVCLVPDSSQAVSEIVFVRASAVVHQVAVAVMGECCSPKRAILIHRVHLIRDLGRTHPVIGAVQLPLFSSPVAVRTPYEPIE